MRSAETARLWIELSLLVIAAAASGLTAWRWTVRRQREDQRQSGAADAVATIAPFVETLRVLVDGVEHNPLTGSPAVPPLGDRLSAVESTMREIGRVATKLGDDALKRDKAVHEALARLGSIEEQVASTNGGSTLRADVKRALRAAAENGETLGRVVVRLDEHDEWLDRYLAAAANDGQAVADALGRLGAPLTLRSVELLAEHVEDAHVDSDDPAGT